MSTVRVIFRLSFWGTAVQRACTLSGFGLALGASVLAVAFDDPFVTLEWVTWGVLIACLPLLVFAGRPGSAHPSSECRILRARATC
jgi:hypothetical protein